MLGGGNTLTYIAFKLKVSRHGLRYNGVSFLLIPVRPEDVYVLATASAFVVGSSSQRGIKLLRWSSWV